MGGWTPLGYEVRDRKLIIHEVDAERVRAIFRRFVQLKSATRLASELVAAGETNLYGQLLDKGVLYKMLNNRIYIGDAVHKGTSYPGGHEPIIARKLWDEVHAILKESPRKRANNTRAQTPALLKGLLFGPDGAAMSPTDTRKSGRLYRYYISQSAMKRGRSDCPVSLASAAELERIVVDQVRGFHVWRCSGLAWRFSYVADRPRRIPFEAGYQLRQDAEIIPIKRHPIGFRHRAAFSQYLRQDALFPSAERTRALHKVFCLDQSPHVFGHFPRLHVGRFPIPISLIRHCSTSSARPSSKASRTHRLCTLRPTRRILPTLRRLWVCSRPFSHLAMTKRALLRTIPNIRNGIRSRNLCGDSERI